MDIHETDDVAQTLHGRGVVLVEGVDHNLVRLGKELYDSVADRA